MATKRPGKRERAAYVERLARAKAATLAHDPAWTAKSCLNRVPTTEYASDYRRLTEEPVRRPSAPKRPAADRQTIKRGNREINHAVDPTLANYDHQLIEDRRFVMDKTKAAAKRANDKEKEYFK